jgi:hypothetical protein
MVVLLNFDNCPASVDPQLMNMEIGMRCRGTLEITIPPNVPTGFHVEIYSPNLTQSLIFGKPYFDYDAGYNIITENLNPLPKMTSTSKDLRVIELI